MSITAFIEICRDTHRSMSDWVLALGAAATPLLSGVRGVHGLGGYSYRVAPEGSLEIIDTIHAQDVALADDPEYGTAAFLKHVNASVLRQCFAAPSPSALVLSEMERRFGANLRSRLPPQSRDWVSLLSGSFRTEGIHLCWLLGEELNLGFRQRRNLLHLAEHMGAGYRLRQMLAEPTSLFDADARSNAVWRSQARRG